MRGVPGNRVQIRVHIRIRRPMSRQLRDVYEVLFEVHFLELRNGDDHHRTQAAGLHHVPEPPVVFRAQPERAAQQRAG